MVKEMKLTEARFPVTEDPLAQRAEILAAASADVRARKLQGRIAMMVKKMAKVLDRLAAREGWEAHLVAYSADYLVESLCREVYRQAVGEDT